MWPLSFKSLKIEIKKIGIIDSVFTVKKNLYICIRLTGATIVKGHWSESIVVWVYTI